MIKYQGIGYHHLLNDLIFLMQIHYISPSKLPSRTANSIHVIHQCIGFCQAGYGVSLYALRSDKY